MSLLKSQIASIVVVAVLTATAFSSCTRTPGYVIGSKQMAKILADMHTAEAVVEMDMRAFNVDSSRQALKQAILEKHGVSCERFDTSLVWYGHHMDKYIDLYDQTISLLEARSAKIGSMVMAAAKSMAGDSVDVWNLSPYVVINDLLPSKKITFDLTADENWQPGDIYTWRAKILDSENCNVVWNMLANYADSTVDVLSYTTNSNGWNEATFITDSTRQSTRLRGSFEATLEDNGAIWIDSIMLIRKRTNPETYRQRHRQRQYKEYI